MAWALVRVDVEDSDVAAAEVCRYVVGGAAAVGGGGFGIQQHEVVPGAREYRAGGALRVRAWLPHAP